MERLEPLINAHNVDRRSAWLANDVALTRRPGSWVLSLSRELRPGQQLPAAAMMLQVIELGWDGHQFRFRFPLPADDPDIKLSTARSRRDYRVPYQRGLRLLVTDADLEAFEREELDPREAAERAGVTVDDLAQRVREWRSRRAPRPSVVDIDEYLARGELRRASALKPPAPRKPAAPPPAMPARPAKPRPAAHPFSQIQAAWEKQEAERLADWDGRIPF